jgi:hypothetical protein
MKFLALVCLIVAVSARPQAPTKFQEDSVSVQPVAVGDPVGFNQERPVVDGQGAPEDGEKRPPQVGGVEADREGRQDGFKPPQEVQTGNVPAQQEDDAEKVEDHDATAPVKPNKSKRQVDEVDVDHDEVKQDDGADNPSDVDAAKEEEKVKPVGGKKKKRQAPVEGVPSENNDDDDEDDKKDEEVKPVKPVSLPAAVDRNVQQGRRKRQDKDVGDVAAPREDAKYNEFVVPEAVKTEDEVRVYGENIERNKRQDEEFQPDTYQPDTFQPDPYQQQQQQDPNPYQIQQGAPGPN